jgi:hypothetical protein
MKFLCSLLWFLLVVVTPAVFAVGEKNKKTKNTKKNTVVMTTATITNVETGTDTQYGWS